MNRIRLNAFASLVGIGLLAGGCKESQTGTSRATETGQAQSQAQPSSADDQPANQKPKASDSNQSAQSSGAHQTQSGNTQQQTGAAQTQQQEQVQEEQARAELKREVTAYRDRVQKEIQSLDSQVRGMRSAARTAAAKGPERGEENRIFADLGRRHNLLEEDMRALQGSTTDSWPGLKAKLDTDLEQYRTSVTTATNQIHTQQGPNQMPNQGAAQPQRPGSAPTPSAPPSAPMPAPSSPSSAPSSTP